MMKNAVVTRHGNSVVESELWLVEYNLQGLHKPVKLTYKVGSGLYSSRCGNYCFDPERDKMQTNIWSCGHSPTKKPLSSTTLIWPRIETLSNPISKSGVP